MDKNQEAEPLLIAGPCSAETEEQLVATAHLLAKTGRVTALRAGIWKPRTRPGEFEGIGSIGLEWLKRAKKETGLPTTVEVATCKTRGRSLKSRCGYFLGWCPFNGKSFHSTGNCRCA